MNQRRRAVIGILLVAFVAAVIGCRRGPHSPEEEPESTHPAPAASAASPMPPVAPGSGPTPAPTPIGGSGPAQDEPSAPTIDWMTSIEIARDRALREGKPVLAVFYQREHGGAGQMRREGFTDHRVAELCQAFVCVQVDIASQPETAEEYEITAAPTLLCMKPDGTIFHRWQGYGTARRLAREIERALGLYRLSGAGGPASRTRE